MEIVTNPAPLLMIYKDNQGFSIYIVNATCIFKDY